MAMTLVSTVTVGSGGAASISFTGIAGTGKDLLVLVSGRLPTGSGSVRNVRLHINGEVSGTNYSQRNLYGNGATAGSDNETNQDRIVFPINGVSTTASTFSNNLIYISNYATSAAKSISIDTVVENNSSTADTIWQQITAGRWNNTNVITSLTISDSSLNLVENSTASLYIIS
jgi:hypothetical protein